MKILKFQKMSDWDELSSIPGKWKFCRIYWQWILIEQAFLYTVVYRTFLYNPTNLKVPKKHRVIYSTEFKCHVKNPRMVVHAGVWTKNKKITLVGVPFMKSWEPVFGGFLMFLL